MSRTKDRHSGRAGWLRQAGIGVFTTAVALAPSVAHAQDAAQGQDDEGVETIIVTASKTGNANAQDLPLSITAFDEHAIERLGTTEFDDLTTQVPGANFIDNGGPGRGNELASLRGLSPVADNTAPVVAQYLDGSPRFGRNYRLFDIGEVSVLRGPQGTLWGAQAVGGLISIRSNRPNTEDFGGYLQGDVYSSDGDGGLSNRETGVINVPISNQFAVRVAGQRIDETGYVDDVASGDDNINNVEENSWRLSALYQPTNNLSFTFIYQGDDLHADAPSYFSTALGDMRTDTPIAYRPADQRYDLYSFLADADLGWAKLSYSVAHFELDNVYIETERDALGGTGALGLIDNSLQQNSWTHELRLSSQDGGPLHWVVGAYYDKLDEDSLSTETEALNPITGAPPVFGEGFVLMELGGPQTTEEKAVFGEVTYDLTSRLSVLGGARYFDWNVDNHQQYTIFGTNYQQATGEVGDQDSFFKFGLNYRLSDDVLLYGLRSEGFRFGGFNPFVGPGLGIPEEYVKFNPDTLTNYEIGVKTTSFDRRLTFNATAYYMDWQDVQTVVRATSGFAFTTNSPDLHAWGAELEAASQDLFVRGLYLSATYAYTENKFTEDAVIFPGTLPLVSKGEELRRTPRQTWSLNAEYRFPLANDFDAFVRANYWHRDATTTEGFNGGDGDVRVPPQDVINASLGVAHGPWQIRGYLDNITNEDPWLQVFPQSANPAIAAEASSIRPRTLGLELTYRFGAR